MQETIVDLEEQNNKNTNDSDNTLNEIKERHIESPLKTKRTVSFANHVNVISDDQTDIDQPQPKIEIPSPKEKLIPIKPRLPLANDILVDKMDSNLRMLIIKELSKDSQIEKPPSKKMSKFILFNINI